MAYSPTADAGITVLGPDEFRQPAATNVAVDSAAQALAATKLSQSAQSDAVGQLKSPQVPPGVATTTAQNVAGNPNAAINMLSSTMMTSGLGGGMGLGGLTGFAGLMALLKSVFSMFAPAANGAVAKVGADMQGSKVIASQDNTGGQITRDATAAAGVDPSQTKMTAVDPNTGVVGPVPAGGIPTQKLTVDGAPPPSAAPTVVTQAPAAPAPTMSA